MAIIICIIVSGAYLLLCYMVSACGWTIKDTGGYEACCHDGSYYTTRIIRHATISTGWQIMHFVLKLSLSLIHAILYNRIAKHFDTASTLNVILGVTCAVIIVIGMFLERDPCKD